jgi:Carboxypeptidase regulatory-like domain
MNWSRASAILVGLIAATAAAEPPRDGVRWRVDATYSLSGRDSKTQEGSFSATYGGFAPSYLRLDGAWFRNDRSLGLMADVRLEWFRLSGSGLGGGDDGGSGVSLIMVPFWGASGAAAEWTPTPWLRFEGALGYGGAVRPVTTYSPTQGALQAAFLSYHGPVLALGASATVKPPYFVELRATTLPVSFRGSLAGMNARAGDLSLELRGGFAEFRYGGLRFLGLAEYEFHRAHGETGDGWALHSETSQRLGLAMRVTTFDEAAPLLKPLVGPGWIRGKVLAQHSRAPIAGAEVVVPGAPPIRTDRWGEFVVPGVGPGPVSYEVRVVGYRTAAETVQVPPGGDVRRSLQLVRKTGPGTIRGRVLSRKDDGSGDPIPGADIRAQQGGATATSEADGSFTLEKVGPGPVTLVVNARNHQAVEEAVVVPPESDAQVQLLLAKAAAKSLASIRGQVRSAKGGDPVKALLQIREARVNARADRDGRFTLRVPGGRYTIIFSARGYVPQTKVVDLGDGDQALFYIDLSAGEP